MTFAVFFALDFESAPWRTRHTFRRVVDHGQAVYEAQIGRSRVSVASTGVRAPGIRELASAALAAHPDAVVAVGLAGALTSRHAVGDILASRATRSGPAGPAIPGDDRLLAMASFCGATLIDCLVSVDHVVTGTGEKRGLARHGDAVDMESFAILREAAERRIPGVAIRTVGDGADEDLPLDFGRAIQPDGTIATGRLLLEAARRPGSWLPLLSFGLRQRRALAGLAGFLDRFVLASEATTR